MSFPPRVRVFLTTYRRNDLLLRAVESLRAQTVADWVCELHNDDPNDPFPAELVRRIADSRITVRTHPTNLGGAETFNLVFRPAAEPFYTLLEDDNWWDPAFLAAMLAALHSHPAADVAWCNQRVWRENADGSWSDTGQLVNPPAGDGPRLVRWGDPRQALGAIHANGAILVRSRPGAIYRTPRSPQTSIEAFRERLFAYPLVYVPAPLAYFAVTRSTARSGETERWAISLVMLAATFVRHSPEPPRETCARLWRHYRMQRPAPTNLLIWAGFIEPSCRPFWRLAGIREWVGWLLGALRRPWHSLQMLFGRRLWPEWWSFLDQATAARFSEAANAAGD